ncbi:Ig-like domain-containing protein [[Pseudomonas] carboxydohydrogena]|uniref:Ig-like domain-containing protein n=1 Tax=Afipia carboxydohydrogena TaxID=290 RepID=UPI0031E62BB6
MKVIDDVPHVSLSINPLVYVGIDESAGSQDGFLGLPPNDTTDGSVRGIFAAFESANASKLGNDTDIAHAVPGSPAIAYAHGPFPIVIPTIVGGADGVANVAYSLQVAPGGVDSGVQTTDGTHIYLFQDSTGLIVGRAGSDAAHAATGTIAFAIAIEQNGDVDIAQYLSLREFNTNSNNETISLTDGVIQAKVVVTDGDGDTASDTVNIGSHILFYDDGPSVSVAAASDVNVVVTTYDISGGSDSSTGLFGSLFTATPVYGADGKGADTTWNYSLSVNGFGNHVNSGLTAMAGGKIYLAELPDGTIVGYTGSQAPHGIDSSVVFSISVDGNGTVTLTQYAAINHGSGDLASLADNLIQLTASAHVTDGDGDGADASKTINIGANLHFQDAMPSAGSNDTVKLDDETAVHTYGTQNAGGAGDVPAANTTGTLAHTFGADGAGSVLLQSATFPANQGFTQVVTNGGMTLTIYQEQNGHTVAVVQVSLTDATSGNYTVTELNPVFQPTHSTIEDNVQFTVNYQVTDGDNDSAPGSFLISVNDDTPTLGAIESITVGDSAIHTGTIAFSAGADGVGAGILSGTPPANLTSGGQAVHYWVSADGHTLIGYTGSAPSGSNQPDPGHQVFVLTLNADDQGYSYQQIQKFDSIHTTTAPVNGADFSYTHQPSGEVDVTYNHGANTIAKVTGSGDVNGSGTGFGVDANKFTNGDVLHFDFSQSDTGTATSSVTFSFTKDGSVNYVVHYSDGSSETVNNQAVTTSGLTFNAPTGATIDYVEFAGNNQTPNGGFKIVLNGVDVDTTTSTPTSDLGFHVALTDGDGDPVGGDFSVTAQNNTPPTIDVHPTDPTNPADAHNLVNEAGLSVIGSDAGSDSEITHGTIHLSDADGASTIQSLTVSLGGSSEQVTIADITGGNSHTFDFTSGSAHGTLTITNYDSSTGNANYTYELTKPVDDATPNNGPDIVTDGDSFVLKVTDSSGATGNATLNIDIQDDVPQAHDISQTASAGSNPTMNAILVLDLSLSMADEVGHTGESRLQLMQTAVQNFLSSSGVTFNQITIYTFGTSGSTELLGQFTIGDHSNSHGDYLGQAKFAVGSLNNSDLSAGTDYVAATKLVGSSTGDGYANLTHPAADTTNLYFLSDGDPTAGAHLSTAQETAWTNFLNNSSNDPSYTHVDTVYAVGFGGTSGTGFLSEIAHRAGDTAEVVTDTNALSETLTGTLPSSAEGNVLLGSDNAAGGTGGGADINFGADGPHTVNGHYDGIISIKVGDVTYSFDGTHTTSSGGATPSGFENHDSWIVVPTALGGALTFYFADTGTHHAGDYSYAAPSNLTANANETFHYVVEDGDGDQAGANLVISVKNILHAPTGLDLNASDDQGTSNSDNITNQTTGLTIAGKADNGTSVTLFDDTNHDGIQNNGEVTLASNVTVTNGSFSTDVTLTGDGTHHVVAFETDGSGDTSPTSTSLDIVIDTTPPAVAVTGIQNDSGVVGDHLTNDNRLVILGTAEAGASVDVYRGNVYIGSTTADGTGHWSVSNENTALSDGTYLYTAVAKDVAGNSATAAPYAVTIDRTPPTVTIDTVAGDNTINLAEKTAGVTITGTNEIGSTVTLDGHAVTQTDATHWSYTLTDSDYTAFGQGSESLTAIATDAAGNPATSTRNITIDTIAPAAGTLSFSSLNDTGVQQTPPITTDNKFSLNLSGEGSGSVIYQVSTDNGQNWVTTGTNQNNIADGDYQYRAIVTDSAGNSSTSNVIEVVIDTAAPGKPTITGVTDDVAPFTGTVANNGLTNDATPTLTGMAEANSIVTIKDGSTTLGTTLAGTDGSWTYTTTPLSDGTHTFTATATDAAGNVGSASSSYIVKTDTTATIAIATLIADDNIVNAAEDHAVVIRGTTTGVEQGQVVTVTLSDGTHVLTETATVQSNGSWTASSADIHTFTNGNITVHADVSDKAGNAASQDTNLTLDNIAPETHLDNIILQTWTTSGGGTSVSFTDHAFLDAGSDPTSVVFGSFSSQSGLSISDNSSTDIATLKNTSSSGSDNFSFTLKDLAGNESIPDSVHVMTDGNPGDSTITGTTGNDLIIDNSTGGTHYTLDGGIGNDILIGRDGDTLHGGDGADTFMLTSASARVIIDDFHLNQNDTIDVTSLFSVSHSGSNHELSDYVRLNGNQLQVDTDGGSHGSGGNQWTTVATFSAGSVPTEITILYQDSQHATAQQAHLT